MNRIALLAALGTVIVWCSDQSPNAPRVGSFNIEDFPRSERQIAGAFAAIAALDLDAVALQEITDPAAATAAATEHLGPSWKAAFCQGCPEHRLGVLYNGDRLRLLDTREHRELVVYRGARPAFEARFAAADGGAPVRIIAVHLKAGGDGGPVRDRQLAALRPIARDAVRSGDRVVITGDFNATGDSDRASIAELAQAAGLTWASRGLECTCYWQRRESRFGAALDHALTSDSNAAVDVGGRCAEECQPGRRCPTYRQEVSDHCPLRIALP